MLQKGAEGDWKPTDQRPFLAGRGWSVAEAAKQGRRRARGASVRPNGGRRWSGSRLWWWPNRGWVEATGAGRLWIGVKGGTPILSFDGNAVYKSIIEATEEFDAKYCIGVRGHGSVYKAQLQTGETVAFYDFCWSSRHSFLVYEFLECGSLKNVLNSEERIATFDWNKRVNVVKGVAYALSYMHHECSPPIIHQDVSSKNILLDEEYKAHMSYFVTAKVLEPYSSDWSSFASTFGYATPDANQEYTNQCKYDDVDDIVGATLDDAPVQSPGIVLPPAQSLIRVDY
ncbi:MDIS1-interacting receptor like kinase 2-like [Eucalyptus grandis]|uniref:MDIS1-interacting receptor like kinase 2-like n=1 Tax=Eucalyptus grandis TaxID=71139 RepID=UPI00192EF082|nr:MDIS1-interacting receptor like kinase 2-like [Eucalyptus grandis]